MTTKIERQHVDQQRCNKKVEPICSHYDCTRTW